MGQITLQEYLSHIDELLDQDRLSDAAAHLHFILQQHPRHLATYRLFGRALLDQQLYDEAVDIFLRVLSADPEDMLAHAGVALAYKGMGEISFAVWHMECANDIHPYNPALVKELQGLYTRSDEMKPREILLSRSALARLNYRSGLYELAETEILGLLEEVPNRVDLMLLLAKTLYRNDRRLAAVKVSLEILGLLPDCLTANAIVADVWLKGGRPKEAAVHLRHVRELTLLSRSQLDLDTVVGNLLGNSALDPLPEKVWVFELEDTGIAVQKIDPGTGWLSEFDVATDSEDEEFQRLDQADPTIPESYDREQTQPDRDDVFDWLAEVAATDASLSELMSDLKADESDESVLQLDTRDDGLSFEQEGGLLSIDEEISGSEAGVVADEPLFESSVGEPVPPGLMEDDSLPPSDGGQGQQDIQHYDTEVRDASLTEEPEDDLIWFEGLGVNHEDLTESILDSPPDEIDDALISRDFSEEELTVDLEMGTQRTSETESDRDSDQKSDEPELYWISSKPVEDDRLGDDLLALDDKVTDGSLDTQYPDDEITGPSLTRDEQEELDWIQEAADIDKESSGLISESYIDELEDSVFSQDIGAELPDEDLDNDRSSVKDTISPVEEESGADESVQEWVPDELVEAILFGQDLGAVEDKTLDESIDLPTGDVGITDASLNEDEPGEIDWFREVADLDEEFFESITDPIVDELSGSSSSQDADSDLLPDDIAQFTSGVGETISGSETESGSGDALQDWVPDEVMDPLLSGEGHFALEEKTNDVSPEIRISDDEDAETSLTEDELGEIEWIQEVPDISEQLTGLNFDLVTDELIDGSSQQEMAGGVSTDDIESDTSPHAETLARSNEEPSPADPAHFESSEEAPVAFEEEVGSESEEFLREAFADLAEEDVQAGSEDDWIEALGTYDNNNQPPDWLYEAVGFTGESELPDDYDLPEWLSEPSSLGENDIVEESSAGDSPEAIGDDPTRAQETDRPEKSSLTDEFGYENLDDVEAQLGADFGEGGRSEWPDENTILGEPFQHGDSSEEDRTTETRKVGGGIDWLSELAAAPSGPDEEGDQTDQTPRSEESEFEASDQVPDWLQRHITEDNSRTDPNEGTFSQNYDQEIEIDDDNDLDPDQDNDLSD